MEKKAEIPGVAIPKNAATIPQVTAVMKRVEAIGVPWLQACEAAGIGRATAFRLRDGKASIAKLREVEDWLVKEEAKRPRGGKTATNAEWTRLGEELAELDPARFESMLEGLRDLVHAERAGREAILKMFRSNPDRLR